MVVVHHPVLRLATQHLTLPVQRQRAYLVAIVILNDVGAGFC
jgi:hypothetical protein